MKNLTLASRIVFFGILLCGQAFADASNYGYLGEDASSISQQQEGSGWYGPFHCTGEGPHPNPESDPSCVYIGSDNG